MPLYPGKNAGTNDDQKLETVRRDCEVLTMVRLLPWAKR